MPRAVVAFGSNIDPARHVRAAMDAIARQMPLVAVSDVYRNPPTGAPGTPDYYNGAVVVDTSLPAPALVDLLHSIERDLGRRRTADRNAPRTIDLDLVLYGGVAFEDPRGVAHVAIPVLEVIRRTPGECDELWRTVLAYEDLWRGEVGRTFHPVNDLSAELQGLCTAR